MGEADAGTGQGNERSHAEPGMRKTPLERIGKEIAKIEKLLERIREIIEEEEEHDFDKWEGTN